MTAIRPLAADDHAAVRALFRSTIAVGRPLPFPLPDLDRYEDLCLGWYLGPGAAHAAVHLTGTAVTGYVLVCPDEGAHQRWVRRRAAVHAARVLARLARRGYDPAAAAFHRARLADGWAMWRASPTPPMPAHVHLNLAPSARGSLRAARALVAHADDVCRRHGLPGWYGEINARVGRRAGALERLGGRVVHRTASRTWSRVLGTPVERLTVVRQLPATMRAAA